MNLILLYEYDSSFFNYQIFHYRNYFKFLELESFYASVIVLHVAFPYSKNIFISLINGYSFASIISWIYWPDRFPNHFIQLGHLKEFGPIEKFCEVVDQYSMFVYNLNLIFMKMLSLIA